MARKVVLLANEDEVIKSLIRDGKTRTHPIYKNASCPQARNLLSEDAPALFSPIK